MKIGELAKRSGVGIDTVRYYEREGLLPPPVRLASGYRDYGKADLQRLQFVRRAKELGFTLPQVRELLDLSRHDGRDMRTVKATARRKLAEIDARLVELRRVRKGLANLIAACPGHGGLDACPILNALTGETS